MLIEKRITQFVALSLTILVLAATSPVSAAEITAPANIGSVSAIGSVQLRGVGVSEGTLFSGDRLNVAQGAYAKVVLGSGPKIEVGGSSDVTVTRDADAVNIQLTSGNIAFTGNGQKPVRVRVGSYEVTATGTARGSVAFVGSEAFGVRVIDGTVSVRNTTTKQSFTVQKGGERLISLQAANQPSALLASSAPSSIPAAPAMPPQALSGGMKTALIVGSILGSAGAIAVLMTKNDDTNQEAANRLARTQALNNTAALAATASTAKATAAQVNSATASATTAIQASTTIPAATKTNLNNQASAITSKANGANAAIVALENQINALNAAINAAGSVSTANQNALIGYIAALEAQRLILNQAINDLLALIQQANTAAGTTIIQNPNIQPIPPADTASPSNP